MQILQCKNVLNIGYINHKKKNLFQNELRRYTLHGFSKLVHFSWTSIPLMGTAQTRCQYGRLR